MSAYERWFRFVTMPTLTLFLLAMVTVLVLAAKSPQQTLQSVNSQSKQNLTPTAEHASAAQTQKADVTISLEVLPGVLTIHAPQSLNNCDNLPKICAGGLLPQDVSDIKLQTYKARYGVTDCRYIEAPRCPTGYKRKCLEECTP
jgi:hypothetical protein